MKTKNYLLLFSLLLCQVANAGTWHPLKSITPVKSVPVVVESDQRVSTVRLSLEGYVTEPVLVNGVKSMRVTAPGATPLLVKGAPDLPKFAVSLVIPDQGEMEWSVVSADYIDIPDQIIAPSKGNLYRDIHPSSVPFSFDKVYQENNFWPAGQGQLLSPYILRDFRGQSLWLQPFAYNPQTKVLRVYTELTLQVRPATDAGGVNPLLRAQPVKKVDPYFQSVYKNHFGNYPSLTYIPVNETPKLLIICPSNWMPQMQEFVDWKLRRGVAVEMVDVLTAGGSASAIQAFIASKYQSDNIGFVLLVGDAAQVPTLFAQGGASDPSYGYILGNDSYAEVFIGRFSAESEADVMTQVKRVIQYERDATPSMSHYSNGVVIGSDQGPGDDGEMDWEHAVNMRTDLINYTYTTVSELYDGTHPGTTDLPGDPSNMDLFNLFQSGLGMMTYTGHGSNQSCATTGLSSSDVDNMTNTGMLPFIWSVACVNGEFSDPGAPPCFAEKFLRAQKNGQPTGAVATLMSSINQSWNPPMDAQDEMVDLLVQSYPANEKFTFGGISVNGCLHMNDNYGQAGAEITDTWHCFGDPTLLLRTTAPQTMTVSHASSIPVGVGTLQVNGSFNGATVCFYANGQILATGSVVNGQAQMTFTALQVPDTIFVTVTGLNQVTYQGQILVIPASGPYVIYQTNTCTDPAGNNNGIVEFDETIAVDITLQNVGLADASNVTAQLTTTDPYVTITAANAVVGNIVSGTSASLLNAFAFNVANNVPDQHVAQFTVVATDNSGNSWNSSFFQTISAPELAGGIMSIDDAVGGDGDGMLEPGETAVISLRCMNIGHSDAQLSTASVSTMSAYLTLISSTFQTGTLASGGGYVDAQFQVSLASNVSVGTQWDLLLDLSAGAYQTTKLYVGTAGIILEDFETGNFNRFNWSMGGNAPWITTGTAPFEGSWCAQSGVIADNESSDLIISFNSLADDSLSFWYKVSSEEDWDFLRVYIDGAPVDGWSGIMSGWAYIGYPLTAGSHTINFSYQKDVMIADGSDCAWLDNIRLPIGTQTTAVDEVITRNGIGIWPNPANDQLNVLIKDASADDQRWTLSTIEGKLVTSGLLPGVNGSLQQFVVDVSGLSAGLYLLTIGQGDKVNVLKVVVE